MTMFPAAPDLSSAELSRCLDSFQERFLRIHRMFSTTDFRFDLLSVPEFEESQTAGP